MSLNNIYEAYCLNHIDISNQDLIVDCGANVGELNLALSYKNIDVNYKAFEPDEMTFKCLVLNNNENPENEFFNLGLSNLNGSTTFYLDNEGIIISKSKINSPNVIAFFGNLDSLNNKKIARLGNTIMSDDLLLN